MGVVAIRFRHLGEASSSASRRARATRMARHRPPPAMAAPTKTPKPQIVPTLKAATISSQPSENGMSTFQPSPMSWS